MSRPRAADDFDAIRDALGNIRAHGNSQPPDVVKCHWCERIYNRDTHEWEGDPNLCTGRCCEC